MGVNDRCTVGACSNNARKYKEKHVIKPHISAFDGVLEYTELRFWKCNDPKLFPKWTFACNRKHFRCNKYTVICSNHFKYGRPTAARIICLQNKALKILHVRSNNNSSLPGYKKSKTLTVSDIIKLKDFLFAYDHYHNNQPQSLQRATSLLF